MEKIIKGILSVIAVTTLVAGCGGSGTVIGNPGTRSFSGTLATQSLAGLVVVKQDDDVVSESCPTADGLITVVLATLAGDEVSAEEAETGDFSTEIDQEQRYRVLFRQGDTTCAELFYNSSYPDAGLRVVLGKGTEDIDVGTVIDLGAGVYVSSSDPSSYCDDDSDGTTDDLDDDADGNGIEDSDSNDDGFIDDLFDD